MTNRATPISLVHHGIRFLLAVCIVVLALGVLPPASLAAVPTGYFVPQVFSTFSSTSAGSLAGNAITVSTTGTFDEQALATGAFTPGSMPVGSGYPSPAPANSGLMWGSSSSTATVTFAFTSPLSPVCHIFVDDVDYDELATLQFFGDGDVLLDPSGYLVNGISTVGLPTVEQNAVHIKFTGLGSGQSEPTHEIIPNVEAIRKIVVTGTNTTVGGGSIALWFTCSQAPPLDKAFYPTVLLKNEASVSTLTFTIDPNYGNPLWQAGFTDALPAGLQVANTPNVNNVCANGSSVTAVAGSGTITFSGLDASVGDLTSCTVSVDVVNKPAVTNPSCVGNPAEFTNSKDDVTTTTLDTAGMTPSCVTVVMPNAVDVSGFWAAQAGVQVRLTWETASEIDSLGFNLYRAKAVDSVRTRLNEELIPSRLPPGSPMGTAYEYADETIELGVVYYYWLEAVDIWGGVETYGPASAGVLTLEIDPGLWSLPFGLFEISE